MSAMYARGSESGERAMQLAAWAVLLVGCGGAEEGTATTASGTETETVANTMDRT